MGTDKTYQELVGMIDRNLEFLRLQRKRLYDIVFTLSQTEYGMALLMARCEKMQVTIKKCA
ncbi:hypothetical protein CEB3_c35400 [Peptococcaceae bacterium CEB3]|nr:hypothetical protein CEB3_c35400 [Peptococcaceae bacterium CEB3]